MIKTAKLFADASNLGGGGHHSLLAESLSMVTDGLVRCTCYQGSRGSTTDGHISSSCQLEDV